MPNDNIITSGSKFNIEEEYGVSSLLEGSGKFHSFKEIKFFMKDVSFNERKSVEVQKVINKRNGKVSSLSGGNRVIYVCSDKNCNFFVKWLRKKNSKEAFYIVDEKPHSELCSSTPKPTIKQLAKLPSINANLGTSLHPTLKVIKSGIIQSEKINISHPSKQSTVYKAINLARQKKHPPSYQLIENLLIELEKKNNNVSTILEIAIDDSFLAVFVSNVKASGLPVYCFDAAHSRSSEYSGKHFCLMNRLPTNEYITICYAIAPSEDKQYISWFLYAAVKSGVDFRKGVTFIDRGHARSTANWLRDVLHILINLKYCCIHIIRNFCSRFGHKENDVSVRSIIFRLQSSESAAMYLENMNEVQHRFGEDEMLYLCRDINPVNWVVFANGTNAIEEITKLPTWVGTDDPYQGGWPSPLFGCRSTNGVEGNNYAAIVDGSRFSLPFFSLNILFESWSKKEIERSRLCRKWT